MPLPRPAAGPPRGARTRSDRPRPSSLARDSATLVDATGLADEVALVRAAIRQLGDDDTVDERMKILAELRHQVETLCRALKTQRALDHDAGSTSLAEMLEELGNQMGLPE